MGMKKFSALAKIIIVLAICALTVSVISPSITMAAEGAAASAGAAAAGATGGLNSMLIGMGVFGGIGLLVLLALTA